MTVGVFLQVFLFTIFLISAVTKLFSIELFRNTLSALDIPEGAVVVGVRLIPALEVFAGVTTVYEPTRVFGAFVVLVLATAFGWSNWRALSRRRRVECSCFGALVPEQFGLGTVLRVLVVAGAGLYLIIAKYSVHTEDIPVADWLAAVFVSLGLVLICAHLAAYQRLINALRAMR